MKRDVRKNAKRYVKKNVRRYLRKNGERISERISKDMSERILEVVFKRMSKDMVQRMSERYVRRYIIRKSVKRFFRKNVKRYVRKNVRKNIRKNGRRYVRQNVRKYVLSICVYIDLDNKNLCLDQWNLVDGILFFVLFGTLQQVLLVHFVFVQENEFCLAAMAEVVVEYPETIFIGIAKQVAKGVEHVWLYKFTFVGVEHMYVYMEPPSITHAGD